MSAWSWSRFAAITARTTSSASRMTIVARNGLPAGWDTSDRLHLPEGEHHHFQEQPSVAKAGDLGLAISPCAIMHRQFDRPQAQFRGSEDQVEIPERIEFAKIVSRSAEPLVVLLPEHLGATQRIGVALIEQIGEDLRCRAAIRMTVERQSG